MHLGKAVTPFRARVAQLACQPFPALVRRGASREAKAGRSVQRRKYRIDACKVLLINRYCSPLNRPPQSSLREAIPALLRRGMCRVTLDSKAYLGGDWLSNTWATATGAVWYVSQWLIAIQARRYGQVRLTSVPPAADCLRP
jgi:hypothetical protein